jgi:hypothetical protein
MEFHTFQYHVHSFPLFEKIFLLLSTGELPMKPDVTDLRRDNGSAGFGILLYTKLW